jgi:uracil-DNA glycosylase
MDPCSQLAEHLRFLTEIGVDGVSRDRSWRSRGGAAAALSIAAAAGPVHAAGGATVGACARSGAAGPSEPGEGGQGRSSDLSSIRADIGDCTRCKLHSLGRRQIVFGVGSPTADLMFIGEAPGRDEDIQGIPFVGRAGQLLTKMIEAIGLTRETVYIANVIKCRPPENRNPEPDEVATCEPFLFRQVESIRPKVIVALGTFAAQALLRTQDSISRLRGRVYVYGGAKLIPTFHPAYLLRSPDKKRDAWEDLKKARALLNDE